jgi:hypothetical protein
LKVGNPGHIPTFTFELLKEAFITYINLIQFEGKTLATAKDLSIPVNAIINSKPRGKERKEYGLLDILKREISLDLTVGKHTNQEEGRIRWTTWGNIIAWFDGVKAMLLDLGFAR